MSRVSTTIKNAFCSTALAGFAVIELAGCSRHESSGNQRASGEQRTLSIAGCIPQPFLDHVGSLPPGYNKSLFKLSHAYPATVPPPGAEPWRAAIHNGQISTANAGAYVAALKDYVSAQMRKMLFDPDHWNAAAEGWYNEPWTGCLREPIHGMYVGTSEFPTDQFPNTNLAKPFSTYVLTFYDQRAANALYNVWGTTAQNPTLNSSSAQFADGSVVVKAAFTTADANTWPVMQGALTWPAYININATKGKMSSSGPREVDSLSFMQFDIIVKDQASSPQTGWVFTTFVYDKDAPGKDIWDKMVPLGAMWGNDPNINPTTNPRPIQLPLQETWINPSAPAYSKTTLGWGGRLSGPNDGALNDAVVDGKQISNLPSSSCMACHISAQWQFKSFLLPTTTNPPQQPLGPNSDYLTMWAPGSKEWMRWFQSTPGTQTMDPGTVPLDYDMVFAFKSLKIWYNAHNPNTPMVLTDRRGQPIEGYNGKPISN